MGRPRSPGVEDIRYINSITGVASSKSRYIDEHGVKRKIEYKINGEWVSGTLNPRIRENRNKASSSKNGYFCAKLTTMNRKVEDRKKQGKFLQGEYEFKDERYGRCDKLLAHYDKQVERYGNKC